jgi:hypothetical protein
MKVQTGAGGGGGKGIRLLFLPLRCYMQVGGQRNASAALPVRKRSGTPPAGRWVGPRASVGGCIKDRAFFFAVALQPNAGHGLILEVSISHTTTHHNR